MNNLENLKQELITQKDLIEFKGGKVYVANQHPSPSEITSGIKSIVSSDLTMSTATEEDVLMGKTFFSGDAELRTGTGAFDPKLIDHIFMSSNGEQTTQDRVFYAFPETTTSIRQYLFYNNINPIRLRFNPELLRIRSYSFYGAKNLSFENFESVTQLQDIGEAAFSNASADGMNFASLPNSITKIDASIFYNVFNDEFTNFRFPDNLTSIGNSIYRQTSRKNANSLDLTNYKLSNLSLYCFEYIAFNCDLIIPNTVKTIANYFNQSGCFRNIFIPSSITSLGNYCFGSQDNDSLGNYYLQTATFESETPPASIGTKIFAIQNIENGFKIFVPDNSVEEYKAVSNLQRYANCIYPISQKD